MACFDSFGEAAYYYLKHYKTIALNVAEQKSLAWTEGRDDAISGNWQLRAAAPERMEGDWSDGKRSLPIVLRRVYADSKGSCTYAADAQMAAFNAPRLEAQKIVAKAALFRQRPYVTLSTLGGAVGGLAFPPGEPAMAPIRQRLERRLREEMSAYFDCSGPGQEYQSSMSIQFWSKTWLTLLESSGGSCGGAHPFYGKEARVVEIASGKDVDLWRWFRLAPPRQGEAPPALNKLILAATYTGDAGCGPALKENSSYHVSLSEKGMMFSTSFPHAIQSCDEDIVLPYGTVLPFLNERGKAAVKAIQAAPN
ncbi:hypothetical protein [Janthinobacterium sp.]|uniref:hypothetical protein n=1 Tax=Janthinobacterium sp. TaxID=1871054 RepID=UPI00293D8EB7|nr:hypothetical protein [Janthinobacterium sp.]